MSERVDESAFLTSMVSSLQSSDPAKAVAAIDELRRYLSALEANLKGPDMSAAAVAEAHEDTGVTGKERSASYKHFFSTGERVVVRSPAVTGAADTATPPATEEQTHPSSPIKEE